MLISVEIKANNGSDRLNFSTPSFDSHHTLFSFVVTFEVAGCRGVQQIYADTPHGGDSIDKFFSDLARDWRGWQGEKKYESLEHDLEITATCDSKGHTTLKVVIRSYSNFWGVHGYIEIDSTQLEQIAKELKIFSRAG